MMRADHNPLELDELELVQSALVSLVTRSMHLSFNMSVCLWTEVYIKSTPLYNRSSLHTPWYRSRYCTYVNQLMWSWEGYSGVKDYPVPSPVSTMPAHEAFARLHNWTGEYGASRRAMVHHMLKCISADIEKVKNE